MFLIIILVFIFIGLIAFDGDYQAKEIQKEYRKFEETIMNCKNFKKYPFCKQCKNTGEKCKDYKEK